MASGFWLCWVSSVCACEGRKLCTGSAAWGQQVLDLGILEIFLRRYLDVTCTIIVDPEAASNLEQAPDPFGFSLQFEWASTLTGLAVSGKAVSIHGGFLSKSEHIGMPRMLHLHMAKLAVTLT